MNAEEPDYELGIRALKERFLDGTLTADDHHAYKQLIEEWSASSAVVAADKQGDERDWKVFERVTPAQRQHLEYLHDYYESRHAVLANLGCAIFYVDKQGAVYAKYGAPQLLEHLKGQGIRIATVFSERNLGCNVVVLAMRHPLETIVRRGSENYLDVFSPYVLLARYVEGSPYGFAGTNVIVAPLAGWSTQTEAMLSHILQEEDVAYKDKFMYPITRERNALIEKSATLSKEVFLLLDADGKVVYTSPSFTRDVGEGVSEYDTHIPLRDFMPELAFSLRALKDGRPIVARSIEAGASSLHYFVDCLPLEEEGRIIGAKVTLRTLGQISLYTAPLRGSSVVYSFDSIIGTSEGIVRCKELAYRASQSASNVLITGESGTGKELFAQAIHHASERSGKPFVAVNCGAIPKELVGSELFGYEEGAFTGAKRGGHIGKIEQAQGGTLFLDEIGEMPLDVQVFLLRFLDSGEITRLGGKKSLRVDVRVISATNRDLQEQVRNGSFRLDLFYRLNVLHIELPPLRDRQADFKALVEHYLKDLSARLGKSTVAVAPDALALFEQRPWPGNLRELRNVIERCVNLIPDGVEVLDALHMPEGFLGGEWADSSVDASTNRREEIPASQPFDGYRDYEKQLIQRLMIECGGNKKRVAERMGISRATLYNRMKRHGIPL